MPFATRTTNEINDYTAASATKSTLKQRITALCDMLIENDAANADEKAVAEYADVRDELAKKFVAKFGMDAGGAKKVAGDLTGRSGLQIRKEDEAGKPIVPLKLAAERTNKAIEIINSLDPTDSTDPLTTILKALGLPIHRKGKKQSQQ